MVAARCKIGTRGIFSSALLPDYSLSLLTGVGIEGTVHGQLNLQGSHNKSWNNKHNDAKDGKRNAAGLIYVGSVKDLGPVSRKTR